MVDVNSSDVSVNSENYDADGNTLAPGVDPWGMTLYGIDEYGRTYYGYKPDVDYELEPFTAEPRFYNRLDLQWQRPLARITDLKLVRNALGYPSNRWDGESLFEAPVAELETTYADKDLKGGQFYYYTMFGWDPERFLWARLATTSGLPVRDWGYSNKLWMSVPFHFQRQDEQFRTDAQPKGYLQRFLELFGWSLDHIRSEYELLKQVRDIDHVPAIMLPAFAHDLGTTVEEELGTALTRKYLSNIIRLYQLSGTLLGFESLVSSLVGWGATAEYDDVDHNVVLTMAADRVNLVPNSSFGSSSVGWEPHTGTSINWSEQRAHVGTHSLRMWHPDPTDEPLAVHMPPEDAILPGVYGLTNYGRSFYSGGMEESSVSGEALLIPYRRREVTPLHHYMSSIRLWSPNSRQAQLVVRLYDDDETNPRLVNRMTSRLFDTEPNEWTLVHLPEDPPPVSHPDAAWAGISVYLYDVPANESHYLDAILLEEATGLRSYFDGSFGPAQDYVWEGLAHESPSHFYDRRALKVSRLAEIIKDHLPRGVGYEFMFAQP